MRNKVKKLWICPRCKQKFDMDKKVHYDLGGKFCRGVLEYRDKSRLKM